MTNPTGQVFLSYRRTKSEDAARLIAAQHDHGIPTWQDVANLDTVPTEDELRRVLEDHQLAAAVLFITPDVKDSNIIRQVEVPKVVKRVEANDGFFAVPVAAGGLDYQGASAVTESILSFQRLMDWNMHKVPNAEVTPKDAVEVALRVLVQRVKAVHRMLPQDEPLRVGLFVRKKPPMELGNALLFDWAPRFSGKEAGPEVWEGTLLPALKRAADAVLQHAPGRKVEAFGMPTLPAALALGCAFLATTGIIASWRQFTPGKPTQLWSLGEARESSGFAARTFSRDPNGRDLAVLVSVSDDVEPVFAMFLAEEQPKLRAVVRVTKAAGVYPHMVDSPGQASDIAHIVRDGIRDARREYGGVGTVHVFVAVPAGLAFLIGQLLNTLGQVQTYEHVAVDGSGRYRKGPLLRPCD